MTRPARRVLFVGDINVDIMMEGLESFPVVDKEITCESFNLTIGSPAAICACAYASLGGSALFLGLAGQDEYGDFMLHGMKEFGIDTGRVRRTDQVGTGVTVNLIHGRTRSQVTYPGTISEFDGAQLDETIFDGIDHAHFAGVYLQTKFRPHLSRILQAARTLGVSTSLDPQWDNSETWESMDQWLPLLDILLVNEDEALSITRSDSVQEALRELVQRTPLPIIKAGRRGAAVLEEGILRWIPTYQATVTDTTGAGDSFDAGFLYATQEENQPLRQAVAFANAVGARSCTFPGGVAARSSQADILKFMRRDYERPESSGEPAG